MRLFGITFTKPLIETILSVLLVLPLAADSWAVQKGDMAPDFRLKDLNGNSVGLAQYKGRYLLINFWATWCVPCKVEMPSLETLYQTFKAENFELLPISNDMFGEKVVRPYIEAQNFSFNILMDPVLKASNRYGVVTLPTSYLVNPDGKIIGVREGADDWASPKTIRFFKELLMSSNKDSNQNMAANQQ